MSDMGRRAGDAMSAMSEVSWFRGPEADMDGDLYRNLLTALYAVHPRVRHYPQACWVMNLDSYKRVRAMAVTEEQEAVRAQAHVSAMISASAVFPLRCPACASGPFGTMRELGEHVTAMADPANREPAPGDCLFGIPLTVTADGGAPHIENRSYPAIFAEAP